MDGFPLWGFCGGRLDRRIESGDARGIGYPDRRAHHPVRIVDYSALSGHPIPDDGREVRIPRRRREDGRPSRYEDPPWGPTVTRCLVGELSSHSRGTAGACHPKSTRSVFYLGAVQCYSRTSRPEIDLVVTTFVRKPRPADTRSPSAI